MQDLSEVLSQLKDIHEPAPVTWWPPAIGWWLSLFIIILCIALVIWGIRRYKNSSRRAASIEYQKIVRDFAIHHDESRLLKDMSRYLRRVAVLIRQKDAPNITGDAWLVLLDELSDRKTFSGELGNLLLSGPYEPSVEFDSDRLISEIGLWVRKLK